jgi:hypothetical protein
LDAIWYQENLLYQMPRSPPGKAGLFPPRPSRPLTQRPILEAMMATAEFKRTIVDCIYERGKAAYLLRALKSWALSHPRNNSRLRPAWTKLSWTAGSIVPGPATSVTEVFAA